MDLSALVPGLKLANPHALGLLAALPVWLWLLARRRRGRGGLTFPHAALGDLPRSWRVRLQPLPDLLRLLVLASLIVGLARPQLGRQREKVTQQGIDIMLALDVSGSMLAEDVQPNRIEAAKQTVARFVSRLQTDRVGLVVFAGRSFTQCPLTTDYGTVLELVKACRINMVGFDGTAIGDALANCIYRFERDAEHRAAEQGQTDARSTSAEARKRSRVIILLTDGANNTGKIQPLDAAEMARVKNIRVHCIGLGSPQGAPIPYYRFGQRMYLQSPDGRLLLSEIDEDSLKRIAAQTGGQYFSATDAQMLDRIYQQIGSMEKNEIEVQHLTRYEEQFMFPVALAMILLMLELFLRSTVLRVTL